MPVLTLLKLLLCATQVMPSHLHLPGVWPLFWLSVYLGVENTSSCGGPTTLISLAGCHLNQD